MAASLCAKFKAQPGLSQVPLAVSCLLGRIVHFDLKSANVLLGRDWTAKIADVGLAKILKDGWLSTLREVYILPFEPSAVHSLLQCCTLLCLLPLSLTYCAQGTRGLAFMHGTCEVEVSVSCRGPTHVRNRECASHGYHANKECVLMSACQGSLAERWTSAHLRCSPQRRLCEVLELEQVALCRWAPSHGQRQRCFWASHAQRRWTSTRMVSCCGSYLLGKHLQEEI